MKAILTVLTFSFCLAACSSPSYKKQAYATVSNTKDLEFEYSSVWKGALVALGEYKVDRKDQESGRIETDWIYSTSNDKFVEYQVNGFPRKKFLQTRYKYLVSLEKNFGKVTVIVNQDEEVEKLKADGSFASWGSVSDPDTARAAALISSIEQKIMTLP